MDLCGLVIGTIVTLVGAVVDFTAPRPTRGSGDFPVMHSCFWP